MDLQAQLEIAILIAVEAHEGQADKGGVPYILHPLRVMHNVDTIEEKIVAVLHDVVEDTTVTTGDLLDQGINSELVDSIKLLTHEGGIPYEQYIRNLADDPLARAVKLADLADNSNPERLIGKTKHDLERLEKYRNAISYLTDRN